MSMRCSLLGHAYGDEEARTKIDDGEGGDIEVNQTVRVCSRCEHEQVVTENKSVRVSEDETATSTEPTVAADGGPNEDKLAHGYDLGTDDAYIIDGDDDAESETEEPEDTLTVNSESGVAFIEDGPGQTDVGEGSSKSESEDESSAPNTGVGSPNGVVFIEDGPDTDAESSDASDSSDEDPTTTESESDHRRSRGVEIVSESPSTSETSDGEADETDVKIPDVESGDDTGLPDDVDDASTGGTAVVWSGNTSSSDAARKTATPDEPETESSESSRDEETPAERRERLRNRQSESGSSRYIRKGGRDVLCPACSFRKNQYEANVVAGDACPGCRGAYLNWAEDED